MTDATKAPIELNANIGKNVKQLDGFFNTLSENEQAVSNEHGLVDVISIEVRGGVKFVTCESIPTGMESGYESVTFDAVEGELHCPIDWQIATAINSCEARIDNGAETIDAFNWLRDEVNKAHKGEFTYDFN